MRSTRHCAGWVHACLDSDTGMLLVGHFSWEVPGMPPLLGLVLAAKDAEGDASHDEQYCSLVQLPDHLPKK